MTKKQIIDSASYTSTIAQHNQQEDQALERQLWTKRGPDWKEAIVLCNYGNLYFLQFWTDGRGLLKKSDWIRKTDVGKKYQSLDMSEIPVRDGVLNKFREEFKDDRRRKTHTHRR